MRRAAASCTGEGCGTLADYCVRWAAFIPHQVRHDHALPPSADALVALHIPARGARAPYTVQIVTTRSRDGTGVVDPANPHPHGKVPAISDDGSVVFESAAIALYLTDKFPKNHLGPVNGEPQRGTYLSWLAYYAGVFEPALVSAFMKIEVPKVTAGWVATEQMMPAILARLSPGPYLLGEDFSSLDVLFGTTSPNLRRAICCRSRPRSRRTTSAWSPVPPSRARWPGTRARRARADKWWTLRPAQPAQGAGLLAQPARGQFRAGSTPAGVLPAPAPPGTAARIQGRHPAAHHPIL